MARQRANPAAPAAAVPAAKLEPDAIGAAQDMIIGMAPAAPAVPAGLTLAALAAASAYGGGPVIVVMLAVQFALRSPFFHTPRESDHPHPRAPARSHGDQAPQPASTAHASSRFRHAGRSRL